MDPSVVTSSLRNDFSKSTTVLKVNKKCLRTYETLLSHICKICNISTELLVFLIKIPGILYTEF